MKKLIVLGLLSLTALSVLPQNAFAWFRCWRCHKYSTRITIRPYNAFSPICYGNVTGVGCSPINLGCCGPMGGGPMGGGGPMLGGCCPPPCMPSCFTGGCGPMCDGGGCGALPPQNAVAQQQPAMLPTAPTAQPMPQGPQYHPPQPMPLNPTAYWGYNPYAYNYGVMQAAAQQQNYYGYPTNGYVGYNMPNYYGYGYNYPTPNYYGQAPSYWYGQQ